MHTVQLGHTEAIIEEEEGEDDEQESVPVISVMEPRK